jgi:hypothetical protein
MGKRLAMNEEEYLENRLEDQINWYDKKSQHNQKMYKRLRLVEIIAASLVTFLAGIGHKFDYATWIIGGLGVVIAVATAAGSLFKYQENWIQYRTTAEQLKHEKFIYLTETNPYYSGDKFPLLVERVESLISKENSSWAQTTGNTESEGAKPS